MSLNTFLTLLEAVRSGDDDAATELFQIYEPQVRRVVRVRLRDPRLRRHLDSVDVCQSVFGDFFARVALGQYDIQTTEQMVALLSAIAHHKVLHVVERFHAQCRDVGTTSATDVAEFAISSQDSTPSERLSRQELLNEFRKRLTAQEQFIADQRAAGASWIDLADQLDETPDAVRVRFGRAIDRVAEQLGL